MFTLLRSIDIEAAYLHGKSIESMFSLILKKKLERIIQYGNWKLVFMDWMILHVHGICNFVMNWSNQEQNHHHNIQHHFTFYMSIQVEDICSGGTTSFQNITIPFKEIFKTGKKSSSMFNHLGLFMQQKEDCITIDLKDYSKSLHPIFRKITLQDRKS